MTFMYESMLFEVRRVMNSMFNFLGDLAKKTGDLIRIPLKKTMASIGVVIKKIGGEETYEKVRKIWEKICSFVEDNGDRIIRISKVVVSHAITLSLYGLFILKETSLVFINKAYDYLIQVIDTVNIDDLRDKNIIQKCAIILKAILKKIGASIRRMWEEKPLTVILYTSMTILGFTLYPYIVNMLKLYIAGMVILTLAPYLLALIKFI